MLRQLTDTLNFPGLKNCAAACLLQLLSATLLNGTLAHSDLGHDLHNFDFWTTSDGLPQNSINAIVQTHDGYIWFATFGGLVRFDGIKFVTFDRGNTPGIGGNRFSSLFEDHEGRIWAGTEDGLLTVYECPKFTTISKESGLPGSEILRMEEDDEGRVWLVCRSAICVWQRGVFRAYSPNTLPGGIGRELQHAGSTWWGTDSRGICYFACGQLVTLNASEAVRGVDVISVFQDCRSNVWVQTRDGFLCRISQGGLKNYRISNPQRFRKGPTLAFQDSRGTVWLTDGEGRLSILANQAVSACRLPGGRHIDQVTCICEDREGSVWIGTPYGLFRARERIVRSYTESDGLSSNNIYTILQDRSGAMWIGSWGGGLTRFKDGSFTVYHQRDGLVSERISALFEDRDGRLWIGAHGGMSQLRNGKPVLLPGPMYRATAWAIIQDHDGNMWFGTDNGLVKCSDGVATLYTTKDGLPDNVVHALHIDRDQTVWVGTIRGLARFQQGRISSCPEGSGLTGERIRAIYEDEDGTLWVGTYDAGLARLKNGVFTRYTTANGLFDNGVFAILDDGSGNFWISCNRGIYRARIDELNDFAVGKIVSVTSTAYGVRDGMFNLECNGARQPSGWKTQEGELWFPTQGGVAVVDPRTIRTESEPPPIVIQQVLLDNEPVSASDLLEVPPNADSFEIRFAALSFIRPEQVRFKYKLSGLDKDWVAAGDRRSAYYSHVRPGTYTFTVTAENSNGVWNTDGLSLKVSVHPPFWRTLWFAAMVTVGIAGLGLLLYKQRVTSLRRANAAQTEFSQQLIETQENERKRIAAELHDGLGQGLLVIKNWAQLGLGDLGAGKPPKRHLEEISLAASQSIQEVQEISRDLRPHLLDEIGLTGAIKAMLRKVAGVSDICFTWHVDQIDGLVAKPAEINVYRIVQECVNNAMKHSGASSVMVDITKNPADDVLIKIEDDGRGFDLHHLGSDRTSSGGFGLRGIAERTRMLGGKHAIQSAAGKGTTVTVRLTGMDGTDGA